MNKKQNPKIILEALKQNMSKLVKNTKHDNDYNSYTQMSIMLDIEITKLHKIKAKKCDYSDIYTLINEIVKMGGYINIIIYDAKGNEYHCSNNLKG